MPADPMKLFEQIAAEAIKQAEAVDCSFADFVRGLRSIEIDIRERLHSAEAELDAQS